MEKTIIVFIATFIATFILFKLVIYWFKYCRNYYYKIKSKRYKKQMLKVKLLKYINNSKLIEEEKKQELIDRINKYYHT